MFYCNIKCPYRMNLKLEWKSKCCKDKLKMLIKLLNNVKKYKTNLKIVWSRKLKGKSNT
jgi:hypothetical protein